MRSASYACPSWRLLIAAVGCLAISCNQRIDTPLADDAAARPATSTGTAAIVVTDDLGRQVRFDSPPRRIVSLVPSSTEIVFALGAGGQLVGVTEYCDFPPEAQQLAQVGGFTPGSLSLETILALQPDAVLATGKLHTRVIAELERVHIPVIALEPELFADVYDNIQVLGKLTGREDSAAALVSEMQTKVNRVEEVAAAIPPAERLRVFYQVWDDPLMAATNRSFIGEMIGMAGAVNIFSDLQQRSPQVSEEAVLDRNPQVILTPDDHPLPKVLERLRQRSGWGQIAALRTNRVELVPSNPVSRPGPRLADGLLSIAKAIYPEQFR